jgi:hypothetical protein
MRSRHAVLPILLAVSCQKAHVEPDRAPTQPADLIAVVSAAAPAAAMTRFGAFVDAIMPGMGKSLDGRALTAVLARAVGAQALDGLDLAQPVHLLVLDPKTHAKPVVVLGTAGDSEKLRRGVGELQVAREEGRVLVGASAEVAAVQPWAFAVLARQPAPAGPTMTIFAAAALARYKDDIAQARKLMGALPGMTPGMATVLKLEIDALLALGAQTDRFCVTLDAAGDTATFDLGLVARPDTGLVRFIKAQHPLTGEALDRLPGGGDATMVMAGRTDMSELGDAIFELLAPLFPDKTEEQRGRFKALLGIFSRDVVAASFHDAGGGLRMTEAFAVDDGAKAAADLRAFFAPGEHTFDLVGFKITMTGTRDAASHDGVTMDSWVAKWDLGAWPPEQRALMERMYPDGMKMMVAGFDKTFAMTLGSAAEADMGKLIDNARHGGGTPLAPPLRAVVDGGKARGESMVIFMDLARAIAPTGPRGTSGVTMSTSFADGAAHLRFALPAAHFTEIAAAIRSSGLPQH